MPTYGARGWPGANAQAGPPQSPSAEAGSAHSPAASPRGGGGPVQLQCLPARSFGQRLHSLCLSSPMLKGDRGDKGLTRWLRMWRAYPWQRPCALSLSLIAPTLGVLEQACLSLVEAEG